MSVTMNSREYRCVFSSNGKSSLIVFVKDVLVIIHCPFHLFKLSITEQAQKKLDRDQVFYNFSTLNCRDNRKHDDMTDIFYVLLLFTFITLVMIKCLCFDNEVYCRHDDKYSSWYYGIFITKSIQSSC